MIGYLRGKVQEHTDGKLLVLTPLGPSEEAAAVGYSVTIPQGPGYALFSRGKWVELSIYTHVREDALELFGFLTLEEKELFLTLLNVNGIGPKVAMAVISGGEVSQIFQAILEGDKAFLTRIPGVGKKTAERIVLELADTIRKKMIARPSGAVLATAEGAGHGMLQGMPHVIKDARDALIGLGYREADVSLILQKTVDAWGAKGETTPRAQDIVRAALKGLS